MTTQEKPKVSQKEQVYFISKVSEYIKKNKPTTVKNDMSYWAIGQSKMIRKFAMIDKFYVQILSGDEETVYLSYCEEGLAVRFFRSELSMEQLDRVL